MVSQCEGWGLSMNRLAYKEGYKYKVQDTFKYDTGIKGVEIYTDYCSLSPDGTLSIYKNYSWDGPSGPALDTINFMRGSLVHDCLYQLIADDLLLFSYRRAADDLLIAICKEDGMRAARRWWVRLAVINFGAQAIEHRNPVLFAPEKP